MSTLLSQRFNDISSRAPKRLQTYELALIKKNADNIKLPSIAAREVRAVDGFEATFGKKAQHAIEVSQQTVEPFSSRLLEDAK